MAALFLFDGECRFSSSAARALQRVVRPQCIVMPYQLVDLPRWQVPLERAQQQVVLVRRHQGTVVVTSGAEAVSAVLRAGRAPWPLVGAALDAPVVRGAAGLAYRVVAANRYRLPGGVAACDLDQAQGLVEAG